MNLDLVRLADLARAQMPGALFVTVSGAHLYGFPSQDSDIDLRGCFLSPLREFIGLRKPVETLEIKTEDRGIEVEIVGHEVGKYLRLLCKHNGYILEQVFSPLVVLGQEFLDRLRPLARHCVTRNCYHHYRGFLQSQLKLLEKEAIKKAKHLLYAYRVLLSGVNLLETGEVQANLPQLNQRFALSFIDELIRRKQAKELGGLEQLDWEWHRGELARWEARLGEAYQQSTLPEEPPWEEMNRFLVELRLSNAACGLAPPGGGNNR